MPPKPDQTEQQPGADRFWGQFSQSTAGRSSSGNGSDPEGNVNGSQGDSGDSVHGSECLEWCPICRSAELFRNTVSPELRQQAESIQHEAVGVLKAFLDAYAEKTGTGQRSTDSAGRDTSPGDPGEPPAPRVTDIPLD
ncbi:MAG: hypothetical protein KDB66_05175 [Solirubrobacterales bacterium]|nr:hypothetical protein [Solirubrobacterales bacterium]